MRACQAAIVAIAAFGGALIGVPAASAEPGAEEQCQQQEQQTSDEQQCEQQNGPGMPDLPDLPDNSDNEAGRQGQLDDTNCWVVNGVPRWNAPGTAPAPAGPSDVVEWCPTFYGLTPHVYS
jgi:hypothetical protein